MDCKELREMLSQLWGDELPAGAREHVSQCAGCEALWRDTRLMQAGFRLLAEEAAPAPSLGFAARLVRRLQEWKTTGARTEFFETVGRRFVYATLALTLALILGMALPNSGPVRGVAGADFLGLQSHNQVSQPDVIGGDFVDPRELIPGGPAE